MFLYCISIQHITAKLRSSGVKKAEEQPKEFDVSELITNLKYIKKEEQDLLSKRNELQSIELKLRNQAIIEFGEKKNTIERLKVQIAFLQKKCNELEQALGIGLPL
jgi:hypothetical protein